MSKLPCIEVAGAPYAPSADHLLESEANAMSHDEAKLIASVLVISAIAGHRRRLAELLIGDGYRVSQVESAADALDEIKDQKFDLVVTGIQMARLDGLELLRIIRDMIPNLPVIAIGDATPEMNTVYLRYAELHGAFQTHEFPPDPEKFLKSVRHAIRWHRVEL